VQQLVVQVASIPQPQAVVCASCQQAQAISCCVNACTATYVTCRNVDCTGKGSMQSR
jgi:hypothetical protein